MFVDDILAAADADKMHLLDKFVKKPQKHFIIRILGTPKKFLGMEISYLREQGICCVSQRLYIEKLAELFLCADDSHCMSYPTTPMEASVYDKLTLAQQEAKFEGPYRSIVGGLLYIFVCTRMDIGFAISILTQQLANPKPTHFLIAKRVLMYLLGTKNFGSILGGKQFQVFLLFLMQVSPMTKLIGKAWGVILYFLGTVLSVGQQRSTAV